MNFTRRLLLLLGLCLAALPAAAQTPESIKARGKIVIGVMIDVPPYGILNAKNEPDGYDVELAKILADRLGVKAELVPVTGPNRIPYLLTGKVDMLVAVLGIIPERAKLVAFSNPYAGFAQFLYGKKELKVAGPADLVGLTIGVPRANTTDIALSKVAPKGATILRFDDDSAVRQALLSGQVDLTGMSQNGLADMEKLGGKDKFDRKFDLFVQVQGIAMRKDQTELLAWTNAQIAELLASGKLNEMNRRWVGVDLPELKMPNF